jgi:hypothetical protein
MDTESTLPARTTVRVLLVMVCMVHNVSLNQTRWQASTMAASEAKE